MILFSKFVRMITSLVRLRKVGHLLLTITNMFEPAHEQYVTEISTSIHSDRRFLLHFSQKIAKLSVDEE